MIKSYNYLFYGIYRLNNAWFGKSEQPVLNTFLVVSLLFYVNLVNLSLIVESITGLAILNFNNYNIWYWLVTMIGVLLLHYWIFIYDRKYKRVLAEYGEKTNRKANLGIFLYSAGSVLLFGIIVIYTAMSK